MQINKLLTKINLTSANNTGRIKYIVIHYVGATGGAKANCQYYAGQYVGASAHYYVDFDGSIWQSVEDKDVAWHCGAKSYKHPECRNANSIGIELCVRNKGSKADTSKDWYFEDATVAGAVQLTKELMAKYGVPASRVIRHHDVTGKICPNPYVYNHTKHTWDAFKAQISGQNTSSQPSNSVSTVTGTSHTVVKGDTLSAIAKAWGVSTSELAAFNGISNPNNINVGQVIKKPSKSTSGKIAEDGWWGSGTTRKAQEVFGTGIDGVISNQLSCYKHLCPGILSAEWGTVKRGGSALVKAMQVWLGITADGYIGSQFIIALQRKFGLPADGVLSSPSKCIAAFQHWLNEQ